MVPTPLARLSTWRQVAVVALLVPVGIGLVLAAFAYPAARTAPRDLPIGLVAPPGAASTSASAGLEAAGFAVHRYDDRASATRAIEHRTVYGALMKTADGTTVLTASAASPAVATLLATVPARQAANAPAKVTVIDVVPLSRHDPRGMVLAATALPLVFGGMIVSMLVAVMLGVRPTRRMLTALVIVSGTTGAAAYAVDQLWLGALPGEHLWTWAALSLAILGIGSTVAGLYEVVGMAGTAAGAVLMLFVGNPFSGITSAPELLPSGVGFIGRLLPPGAGIELVRSTAYFHGHGSASHVAVLAGWVVVGMTLIAVGHARQARTAAVTPTDASPEIGRHAQQDGGLSVGALAARG